MSPIMLITKRLKIMTPKGEATGIRVALGSGVVYFDYKRPDDERIVDSFTLEECKILIVGERGE